QYADFLPKSTPSPTPTPDPNNPESGLIPQEPDDNGLDYWTSTITGNCGTGLNDNSPCTHERRINVSRAFWVDQHASLFTSTYGLNSGKNSEFVHLCYKIYLRRDPPDSDSNFQYWLGQLGSRSEERRVGKEGRARRWTESER